MSAEETIRAYLEMRISRRDFMERLQAVGVTAGAAFAYAELLGASTFPTLTGYPATATVSAQAYRTAEYIQRQTQWF